MGEVSCARIRARQIIQGLKIIAPEEIFIEDIAWTRGALVREGPLSGADGRLVRGSRRGVILVREDVPEPGRKRFIIAHELGHLELHGDGSVTALCADEDLQHWNKRTPQEYEATEFAGELLMPEALFATRSKDLVPSFQNIENLATIFQTTLTATAVRFVQSSNFPCALLTSTQAGVGWSVRSEDFRHWIQPGTPLDEDTFAFDFHHGTSVPHGMQTVPASAWIKEARFGPAATIREESRFLARYGTVLTLLWIDKDIDDEDEGGDSDADPEHFTPDGKRWRW